METYLNPARETWAELCSRPSNANPVVRERVEAILQRVREQGDEALRQLSLEIDRRPLEQIEVSPEEILEAEVRVSGAVKRAVAAAEANIRAFHEAQRPREISVETAPGVRCIQRPVPIERVQEKMNQPRMKPLTNRIEYQRSSKLPIGLEVFESLKELRDFVLAG